jgi:lambda family phage portal protein
LNWLDRAIDWLSPAMGLKRARARHIQEVLLGYEGVRSTRRQGGWNTAQNSGNAEMGVALTKLRDNARDLVRNNAYAKKAVREWSKRVVGWGITPQADTGSASLNEIIDQYWEQWVPQCMSDRRLGFYAAQKLICRAAFESGECLVRIWDRRIQDQLAVPFQIQILESDYLDINQTKTLETGYILHGIEFDPIGRIRGYWLFGQHPGDVVNTRLGRNLASRFVPAEVILHHAEIERPGDVRAVTRFAPVMNKLRDVDEYADAEIVRKKIEACLTAMITQPEGADGPTMGSLVTDADGNKVEKFQPGMIMYGAQGVSAEFFAPSSSGDFASHKKTELREVSTGLGIPYVTLADDLSDVNYSSYRGGAVAYRDDIDEYRWNWFIPQVLDPIWRKFVDTLYLMGGIPEANYGVKWNPPPFDLLDRESESKADMTELLIGKKTWPQMLGEQGRDPEKQFTEIAAWKPRLDSVGVSFNPKGNKNGEAQNSAA